MENKGNQYKFGFSVKRRVRMMVGKKAIVIDWHQSRWNQYGTAVYMGGDSDLQGWRMMINKRQMSGHMMCDPVYVLLPEKNTPQDQVYVISRNEFVIFLFTFYFAQPWVHLWWIAYSYSISTMSVSFQVYW